MATKHLELVLKGEWYDKIASGEKKYEYRRVTPYWVKRVFGLEYLDFMGKFFNEVPAWLEDKKAGRPFKGYSHDLCHTSVRFRRGYGKNAPTMVWEIGNTGHIVIPPVDVQAEVGDVPVIQLTLLKRVF